MPETPFGSGNKPEISTLFAGPTDLVLAIVEISNTQRIFLPVKRPSQIIRSSNNTCY